MHPMEGPTPGVWRQAPGEFLPAGAAVAYFDAFAFFLSVVLSQMEQSDTEDSVPSTGAPQSSSIPDPFSGRGMRLSDLDREQGV